MDPMKTAEIAEVAENARAVYGGLSAKWTV